MTTIIENVVTCAVCRQVSKQSSLASTNEFGSPDLDTRPPPMMREALLRTMQQCPHCGYCAPDIKKAEAGAASAVADEIYQQAATDPQTPDLVRRWHCRSLILEAGGELAQAGWSKLSAAWACDDAELATEARQWRHSALTLFHRVQEQEQMFAADQESELAILTDLQRRTGSFDAVINLCDQNPESELSENIAVIMRFQRALAIRQDAVCHTIEEAWKHRQA